jgi:hypothetical protein
MNTSHKRLAVARIADEYRARGYSVVIEPAGAELPGFLEGYRPDLIARSPSDSVVLAVRIGSELAQGERLRPIAERVEREPGWRLSLVVVRDGESPTLDAEFAPPLSIDKIRDRFARAQELAARSQDDAAFLLLWTSLEALLRRITDRAHFPLHSVPTSTLIRELQAAGELDRSQYDRAMRALTVRNALVHGLSSNIGAEHVRELAGLTRELLGDISSAA